MGKSWFGHQNCTAKNPYARSKATIPRHVAGSKLSLDHLLSYSCSLSYNAGTALAYSYCRTSTNATTMGNKRLHFKKGEYQCAYCNEHPGIEKEHVIPRGFFAHDDNGIRIIVPACGECNDNFSKDEEYARMVFTMEFRGGEHPSARSLMNKGKAYRALQQNQKLLKSMLETMHTTRVSTRGGIELPGTYHAFTLERPTVDRFIDKVVRGVFFDETLEHLPKAYSIEYWTDDISDISTLPDDAQRALLSKPLKIVGNNVFQYRFARTIEDPMCTLWIMRFYK